MTWRAMLAVVYGVLLMPAAGGQDLGTSGRFQLFDDCKPMGLEVGHGFGSALGLGIYMKDVRAAAESRLREAHLYSSDNPPSLYVDMSGYAIQLKYKKRVRDIASGEIGSVWTFSKAAGVRDGTRATIMLELSNLLDTFLVEYLRANESACGQMVTGRLKPEEVITNTPERSPPAVDITAAEPALFRISDSMNEEPQADPQEGTQVYGKGQRSQLRGCSSS